MTFNDQNGDTGVSRFWPLEMAINMFQKHQKKFGTPRCGGKTGSGSLSFDPFRLLKTAKMAMFEVIPRASWRSNSGSEALFHSELTQILKFWSQNFFCHLDPWRTGMFLKGEFYRNFKIKPCRAITWKQKLLPMTSNDVWNHVGLPWSSSPIIHNSKWSIRTPPVLTKKEPRYKNVCKTKVAPNDQ